MANLTETSNFDEGIYRIETSDPVLGGESGIANKGIKNLANRTKWLKEQIENIQVIDNHQEAIGTTTIAGTPATEVDMDDMTITFTPKGKKIHVFFDAKFDSSVDDSVFCKIKVGATSIATLQQNIASGTNINFAMHKLYSVTPIAEITVKVRWIANANIEQHGGLANRTLTIIDLP